MHRGNYRLSTPSCRITNTSRAKASPLYPTVTSRRKSYLDNWISGTRLPMLHLAHRWLSSTHRESSEQREGRPSVCLPHTAHTNQGKKHQCKAALSPNVPFEMAPGGRFRGSAHGPKGPECCKGAGLLQVTVNIILDEGRVPCQQGLQPGLWLS